MARENKSKDKKRGPEQALLARYARKLESDGEGTSERQVGCYLHC